MLERRLSRHPEPLGQLEHRRALEHGPVLEQRDGQPVVVHARHLQQLPRLRVALDVKPPGRDEVAREEVAQLVGGAREAVADQAHPARFERGAGLPRAHEVSDDREQLLLGWVPGLEQVIVEVDLVDRLDRRLGVGVGGEKHALGGGHELARAHEVVGSREAGHALVGHQQRHLLAAANQLAQDLERFLARAGADDPVALPEPLTQVAGDRGQDRRLVVDYEDHGEAARGLTHRLTVGSPMRASELSSVDTS